MFVLEWTINAGKAKNFMIFFYIQTCVFFIRYVSTNLVFIIIWFISSTKRHIHKFVHYSYCVEKPAESWFISTKISSHQTLVFRVNLYSTDFGVVTISIYKFYWLRHILFVFLWSDPKKLRLVFHCKESKWQKSYLCEKRERERESVSVLLKKNLAFNAQFMI